MKEIKGNIWDYYSQGYTVCITTNGTVKKDGTAVMGAGVAKEAAERFPSLPAALGASLSQCGNVVGWFQDLRLITFPVKRGWWEKADPKLITQSLEQLLKLKLDPVILVRPGSGNGRLDWEKEVKPLFVNIPDSVWVINND